MDGRRPVAEKALKTPGLPFNGSLEEVIFANRLVFHPYSRSPGTGLRLVYRRLRHTGS